MYPPPEPSHDNGYLKNHAAQLLHCQQHWTRRNLIDLALSARDATWEQHLARVAATDYIVTGLGCVSRSLANAFTFKGQWYGIFLMRQV